MRVRIQMHGMFGTASTSCYWPGSREMLAGWQQKTQSRLSNQRPSFGGIRWVSGCTGVGSRALVAVGQRFQWRSVG
jgi:hypothetical protein